MKAILLFLLVAAVAGLVAAAAVIHGGAYDVSATKPHLQTVYSVLELSMHSSVRRRARGIEPPAITEPMVRQGGACYVQHCLQCHGAPGIGPGVAAKGMQPAPGPLVDSGQRWTAPELYWIVRHGIKMSGMPAWQFRLSEDELWSVVGFMQTMPGYSAREFKRFVDTLEQDSCPAT